MYKKLSKILDHKDHCMIKRDDGKYSVFSSVKDESGDFRDSGWLNTKEEAKKYIGDFEGYVEEDINIYSKKENWKIVEIWDNPKQRFTVGEKVRIADNAKELCEEINESWNDIREEMIDKICEIENTFGSDYCIWDENKKCSWLFPHSALIPVFEEEEDEVTIKVSKKSLEALKESGIKIIKE